MKTVNITLKIEEQELTNFESWLRQQLEVIDFQIIPDTSKLYETDLTFRKLIKKHKEAKDIKNIYINEYNLKQKKDETF